MSTDRPSAILVEDGYVRTPFAKSSKIHPQTGDVLAMGSYGMIRPDDMAAELIKALISRTGIDPKDVDTVIFGTANPEAEQGNLQMRAAALKAGLPDTVSTYVLTQLCGSATRTLANAKNDIAAGEAKAIICVGAESMSRVPATGYNFSPDKAYAKENPGIYAGMVETADNIFKLLKDKYGEKIDRAAQEAFSMQSHFKSATAWEKGYYDNEIVILPQAPQVTRDECISWPANEEKIKSLRPVNQEGIVTAATSSPVTDGATAALVVSEEFAKQNGLTPQTRLGAFSSVGVAPEIMGLGPIYALQKLMEITKRSLEDYPAIDINEAFAVQVLGVLLECGIPLDKVNLDGGAVSLGHPLGASGIRVPGHLSNILARENLERGIATACVGGGPAVALELENLKFKP